MTWNYRVVSQNKLPIFLEIYKINTPIYCTLWYKQKHICDNDKKSLRINRDKIQFANCKIA